MKEYKVTRPNLGWRNKNEKLETFLNDHAKQGWSLLNIHRNESGVHIIFERNKNR